MMILFAKSASVKSRCECVCLKLKLSGNTVTLTDFTIGWKQLKNLCAHSDVPIYITNKELLITFQSLHTLPDSAVIQLTRRYK